MPKEPIYLNFPALRKLYLPNGDDGSTVSDTFIEYKADNEGNIYIGGYTNDLDNMGKDIARGGYQGYLSHISCEGHAIRSWLQLSATVLPSVDMVLGSTQDLRKSCSLTPRTLPLSNWSDYGFMFKAGAGFSEWLSQTGDITHYHTVAANLSITAGVDDLSTLLIPGVIEQKFKVTPKGYQLETFTVSNTVLKRYIEGEFTKDVPVAGQEAAYIADLQQKLLPGFKEDAENFVELVGRQLYTFNKTFQLDDINPMPYMIICQKVHTLLKAVAQYEPGTDEAATDFLAARNAKLKELQTAFAKLPNLSCYQEAKDKLGVLIKAIDDNSLDDVHDVTNKTLLPYLMQNIVTDIAKITLERSKCLQQEAQALHGELQYIVKNYGRRPKWLQEKAQAVLDNYQEITPANYFNFLSAVDLELRYQIGYFNYRDFAFDVVLKLEEMHVPEALLVALMAPINKATKALNIETKDISTNDERLKEIEALHACISPFVDAKVWAELQDFSKLDERIRNRINFKPPITVDSINQFFKQVDVALSMPALDHIWDRILKFQNVLPAGVIKSLQQRVRALATNTDEAALAQLQCECDKYLSDERYNNLKHNEAIYQPFLDAYQNDHPLDATLISYMKIIGIVQKYRSPMKGVPVLAAEIILTDVTKEMLATAMIDSDINKLPDDDKSSHSKMFMLTNAALFQQQLLEGPLNKPALFGFIETELAQFAAISNNEILALADKFIEDKVATLAKQSGQTDLYSKTHFRYYYNQELFVALQARQDAGLAYLDSKVVATIPTLNDAHFYSEIYTGIAMIGLAVGAMCATAALVIALPEVMAFSAPVIIGDLLLSTQLLQVGIASVFGIMESMMLYNSVQALRDTKASYFKAENVMPKVPTAKSSKSATKTTESAKGGADANVPGGDGIPADGDDDSTDVKLGNIAKVKQETPEVHQRVIPIPVF